MKTAKISAVAVIACSPPDISESEASFFVTLRAASDRNQKYSDLALPYVERKIELIERRKLWSKADIVVDGKKLGDYQKFRGGEQKECVAIFNPLDPEADKIVVSVHGLANDLVVEKLSDNRLKITERVLELTFTRPGDQYYPAWDKFKFVSRKWKQLVRETSIDRKAQ